MNTYPVTPARSRPPTNPNLIQRYLVENASIQQLPVRSKSKPQHSSKKHSNSNSTQKKTNTDKTPNKKCRKREERSVRKGSQGKLRNPSNDKTKGKQFVRKTTLQENRRSKSKKTSKKSTDNENE